MMIPCGAPKSMMLFNDFLSASIKFVDTKKIKCMNYRSLAVIIVSMYLVSVDAEILIRIDDKQRFTHVRLANINK
jgi:hypothetical protein